MMKRVEVSRVHKTFRKKRRKKKISKVQKKKTPIPRENWPILFNGGIAEFGKMIREGERHFWQLGI